MGINEKFYQFGVKRKIKSIGWGLWNFIARLQAHLLIIINNGFIRENWRLNSNTTWSKGIIRHLIFIQRLKNEWSVRIHIRDSSRCQNKESRSLRMQGRGKWKYKWKRDRIKSRNLPEISLNSQQQNPP